MCPSQWHSGAQTPQGGCQLPRPQSSASGAPDHTGGPSLLILPLSSLWSPQLCQGLRPCCLLSTVTTHLQQGKGLQGPQGQRSRCPGTWT